MNKKIVFIVSIVLFVILFTGCSLFGDLFGLTPVASFEASSNIPKVGEKVILNGSRSTGSLLSYSWVIKSNPNGSTAVLSSQYGVSVSLTPNIKGIWRIQLTVSNIYGSNSASVTLNVGGSETMCTLTPGNASNGSMSPATNAIIQASVATNITALPAPGYKFSGWSATPSGVATFANQTAGNTTVTLTGDAVITPLFVVSKGVTAYACDSYVWLQWPAAIDATSYTVYWQQGTMATTSSPNSATVSGRTLSPSGLTNGQVYAFLVVPDTGAGFPVVTATPTANQPSFQTVSPDNGQVTVTWKKISGAGAYYLLYYLGEGAGPGIQNIKTLGPYTEASTTIAGLTNSDMISARVCAVTATGNVMSEALRTSADIPVNHNYLASSAIPATNPYNQNISTQVPQWTWTSGPGDSGFTQCGIGMNLEGSVVSSYEWDSFQQTIDISSLGAGYLQSTSRVFVFSIWCAPFCASNGEAAFTMELLDSSDNVLATISPYTQGAPFSVSGQADRDFLKVILTYTNANGYAIAKVRITVYGKDTIYWAGNYGIMLTLPSLSVQ